MLNKSIAILKKYFLNKPDISAAFLFGSQAKTYAGKISDWDIAVYFWPKEDKSEIEWEEAGKAYPGENKIWDDLVDILKTDNVDLVVLNRAPANIAASAISEGRALVIKDRKAFLDFMLVTMRQAEDYSDFVDTYYKISQRSSSLGQRDREKLKKIIDFLSHEVSSQEYFSKFDFNGYQDAHKRRDIERWVENMINSAIDIGEVILASEKKKIPDYYKDVFVQLGLLPQFRQMDVAKFTGWVKLRNILAHEYLDLKWQKISSFAQECKTHFAVFLEAAKEFLK
ncbi:MAG: DUF86 domain-containing protein [Candidatus Omnitrophota bacterium]|nr:DUF86 domain-containing protein [Candidatus Omnitrophota bacterium]